MLVRLAAVLAFVPTLVLAATVHGTDAWQSTDAAFAGMSEGGDFERWSFTITDPAIAQGEVRFAIRYDVAGDTLWDDNCGWNYQLTGTDDTASGHACE